VHLLVEYLVFDAYILKSTVWCSCFRTASSSFLGDLCQLSLDLYRRIHGLLFTTSKFRYWIKQVTVAVNFRSCLKYDCYCRRCSLSLGSHSKHVQETGPVPVVTFNFSHRTQCSKAAPSKGPFEYEPLNMEEINIPKSLCRNSRQQAMPK
jgi:hypothetical protein